MFFGQKIMNILMINYEYPPLGGGGGVINKHLAEELSKKNNITLITTKFTDQKSYEICNNVEVFRVPVCFRNDKNAATLLSMLSFFPSSLWRGYRLLTARQFDLIHSMFVIPSAPSGFMLAKMFCLPHVLSILGGDIYDPSKRLSPHKTVLLHTLVDKILTGSDKIIGMSSDIIGRLTTYYSTSAQIELIPHGIERPVFAPKAREELGYDSKDILLVTVGRLIPRKAIHDLISALQSLNKNTKLLIIGDGPERQRLQEVAESLRVSDRTLFLGNVSEETKFQLLNIADMYVSATRHEGFGLVFLEAMAVGLPIVSYDNGGHMDFLSDNQSGFLVRLGNVCALIHRIKVLSEDTALRRRMGQWNRQRVEDYYIASCAAKYQALYEAVVPEAQERSVSNSESH
jgi:glycosyltransferase involved in cell wall biosynthesis